MTLAELNGCDRDRFVQAVGGVFDGAPWVAERAWRKRPFLSFDDLSTRLIREVQAASPDVQLTLLLSAPAAEGVSEQMMEKYRRKFGFPFIYAVKQGDADAIADAWQRRMNSPPEQEFQVALGNVFRIARFRLEEIVTSGGA